MVKLEIEIPNELKEDRSRLEEQIEELVSYEARRRVFLELTDEIMEGTKQLSDDEVVELARKFKKGRFKQLQKRGIV